MNFTELAQLLPNGFHDATILRFSLDAESKSLQMRISIWISELEDQDLERYRSIDISAAALSLFFLEAPDPAYPFLLNAEGISASGDSVSLDASRYISPSADAALKKLPSESQPDIYRFFLHEWNSFLYLVAKDVSYQWV